MLIGITVEEFLGNFPVQKAFIDAIYLSINVKDSKVTILEVTNNLRSRMLSSQLQVLGVTSTIVVSYEILYPSTSIAQNATLQYAYTSVVSRLNTSLVIGDFVNLFSQQSVLYGVVVNISIPSVGLAVEPSIVKFGHSAYPTGKPTSQPSGIPSSQPSSLPTSSPTLTQYTKWNTRLTNELDQRLSKTNKDSRNIYFEMTVDNISYYGGPNTWSGFVRNMIQISIKSKKVPHVSLLVINSTTQQTKEFTCDEVVSANRLAQFIGMEMQRNMSVKCGDHLWQVSFCGLNSTIPHICVDCKDPCQDYCLDKDGMMVSGISPHFVPCHAGWGYIKIFYMRLEEDVVGATSVVSSFSGMWILLLLIISWKQYQNRNRRVDSELKLKILVEASGNLEDINNDKLHQGTSSLKLWLSQRLLGDYFLDRGWGERVWRSITNRHRMLLCFQHSGPGPWYGFYSGTVVVTYGFLIQIISSLQYPYDDGTCALQNSERSCLGVRSRFLDSRAICTWQEIDTSSRWDKGELLFEPGGYQTNCFWHKEDITIVDALRTALVSLLIIIPLRILVIEPIMKKYLMVPSRVDGKSGIDSTTVVVLKGKSSASSVVPLSQGSHNKTLIADYNKSRQSLSPHKVVSLANAPSNMSDMQDYFLELGGIDGSLQSSPDKSSLRIKIIKDQQDHDHSDLHQESIQNDHHQDMNNVNDDDYHRYMLELRIPEISRAASAHSRMSFNSSYSKLEISKVGKLFTAFKNNTIDPIETQVVHREEKEYSEDTLKMFLEALFSHRLTIYDTKKRRKFDEAWAIRNSEFNQDKIINRNFSFWLFHIGQHSQTPADYIYDFLKEVHIEYGAQRKEIKSNTDSLPRRLMVLLLLDVIGLFNYDTEILRRRLYRQLNPRPAVDWRVRLFVFVLFLLLNALLMFFTWKHLHDFPRDRLYRWYGSLLTALIVDFAMVETTDVWWSNFLVPSQCKEVWRQGVETVLAIIDQSELAVPRDIQRFDMTKYLYVSKQVAKLFPSLVESQIILKYMCEAPGRVLTGPWRDNLDIVYARDGLFNSWKTNIRKYWREGGYKKDVRETIKWMGTLPMAVQRLIVCGWVVASMFALWYFIRGWIAWSGIWWFGVAVVCSVCCCIFIQWTYTTIPYVRHRFDLLRIRFVSIRKFFGLQAGVLPFPIDEVVPYEVAQNESMERLYAPVSTTIVSNISPLLSNDTDGSNFNLFDIYPQIAEKEIEEKVYILQQMLYDHASKNKETILKQWTTQDFELSSNSDEEGKQRDDLFELSDSSVSSDSDL